MSDPRDTLINQYAEILATQLEVDIDHMKAALSMFYSAVVIATSTKAFQEGHDRAYAELRKRDSFNPFHPCSCLFCLSRSR